jgi:hypothetical protein
MQTEDLAYQVRAGSMMWQMHAVLRSDAFTFTVGGQAWHDQQWGAQLILAGIHGLGGWRGLVLVRALIVGGAVGMTYLRTRWRGAAPQAAIVATIGAFVVSVTLPGSIAMRPQLLAVPLFLAVSVILAARSRRPSWLWAIPAIGVLWVNVHGSFILLPLLCGIAFVADLLDRAPRWRTTGALFGAALVVPLVNPWGYRSYTYVIDLARAPIVRSVIDEWRPMWRQWPAGLLFGASIVGLVILMRRGGWSRLRIEDRCTIVVFTALAIAGGRNVVWWSLAVPPAVGAMLPTGASTWSRSASTVARVAVASILALALLRLARLAPEQTLSDAPAGITTATVGAGGTGTRVFAGWWQSWLEFAAPETLQFVDARAEIFPPSVWDEYFQVSRADPGWEGVLDQRGVDMVVASRNHQAPLIAALSADARWREIYSDGEGVVFERISTDSSAAIP